MSYLELGQKIETLDKSIDDFFSRLGVRARMAKASIMLPLTAMGHSKEVTFISTANGAKLIQDWSFDQELLTWVADRKLYMDVWGKIGSNKFTFVLSYGPIKAPRGRTWVLYATTRGNTVFLKNTRNAHIESSTYADEVLSSWGNTVEKVSLPALMERVAPGDEPYEAVKSMGGGHWQQLELLHAYNHQVGRTDGSACNHECKWKQVDTE